MVYLEKATMAIDHYHKEPFDNQEFYRLTQIGWHEVNILQLSEALGGIPVSPCLTELYQFILYLFQMLFV